MPLSLAVLLIHQGAISLIYQPRVGASYKFSVDSSLSGPTGSLSMTAESLVKILAFNHNYYRVETTLSNLKSKGAGNPVRPMGSKVILDYNKFAEVKFDGKNDSANGSLMGSFQDQALGMQFPHHSVKVGDVWQNSVDFGRLAAELMKTGAAPPKGKLLLTFKLVQTTAKSATVACGVKGSMSTTITTKSPNGQLRKTPFEMTMTGNGQFSIERATGVYFASSMKLTVDTAVDGRHSLVTQSVSMKRVSF